MAFQPSRKLLGRFWDNSVKLQAQPPSLERFTTVPIPRFGTAETLHVRVRIETDRDGPWTLVCVHGFGDNLHTWKEVRAIVRARGGRVCRFDLPGFGASPLDAEFASHYSIHAVELARRIAIDAADGAPLFLLGNSLGGAVCLGATQLAAGRVDGTILLSPATPDTRTPIFVRLLRVPTYRWVEGLVRRLPDRRRRVAVEMIARAAFRTMLAPGVRPSRDWWESVVQSLGRPGAFLDVERIAREVMWVLRGKVAEINELTSRIDEVSTPVAVVRGNLDRVIGRAELDAMVAALPDARYHALAGVAHCPQNEAAEETARIVLDLVEEVAPGVSLSARRRSSPSSA